MTKLNNKHLFDKQKSTFEEMAMFGELSKKCIDGHKITITHHTPKGK
jgi:hypothetical protein